MKITVKTPIILVIALMGIMKYPVLAQSTGEDKKAIIKAIENSALGWEQKDVELATMDYAEKTDWTNAFGDRCQSRKELKEFFQFLFKLPTVMAGNTKQLGHDVTFLGNTVALVRSKSKRIGQKLDDGSPHGDRNITHLRVFEKRAGKWLIISHLIAQELDDSKR